MTGRIGVFVYGSDPISQAGVASQLRGRPRISVVDERHIDDAQVAVVVVDQIDDDTARTVRGIQRDQCPRIVLVASSLDEAALLRAVEALHAPEAERQRTEIFWWSWTPRTHTIRLSP